MLKCSWSLSSTLIAKEPLYLPSSSFIPHGTKMATLALPAAVRGVGDLSPCSVVLAALPSCYPSQVAGTAAGLCPHTFAFQYLRCAWSTAWYFCSQLVRFPARRYLSFGFALLSAFVDESWVLLFFFLGRQVMYLIQVNNSHDYCKKYSCFCSASESKFLETALVLRQNSQIF